ncbi:hypothetical protein H4R21_001074, partial [Coemansia helicoidea]
MDGSGSNTDENAWLAAGLSPSAPASASPTAHTRGLTSTLSGRRTRHEHTPAVAAVASDSSGQQPQQPQQQPAWRATGRRVMRGFADPD